jgi:hypothetical protein
MPAYRYGQCGKFTDIRNGPGRRIKDHPCSHCGAEGTLQGAAGGRKSRNAGRGYERLRHLSVLDDHAQKTPRVHRRALERMHDDLASLIAAHQI